MFFNQELSDIERGLDYSIGKGHHQAKILACLRNNLYWFSKDFKTSIAPQGTNVGLENYISQELQFFLNNKASQSGYLFGFQAEGPDIFVRQSGSCVHGQILLFIEAKRLPPTSSQDYVKTGIGRFKKEEHGKQHDFAAMLGYVQKEDFNYWHSKVNSWIDDMITNPSDCIRWSEKDKITVIKVSDLGEYKSTHARVQKNPITLYHFWINFCDN